MCNIISGGAVRPPATPREPCAGRVHFTAMKTASELLELIQSQCNSSDETKHLISVASCTATTVVRCSKQTAGYWLKQLLDHEDINTPPRKLVARCIASVRLFGLALPSAHPYGWNGTLLGSCERYLGRQQVYTALMSRDQRVMQASRGKNQWHCSKQCGFGVCNHACSLATASSLGPCKCAFPLLCTKTILHRYAPRIWR